MYLEVKACINTRSHPAIAAYSSLADNTSAYYKAIALVNQVVDTKLKAHIATTNAETRENKVNLLISCLKHMKTQASSKAFWNKIGARAPKQSAVKKMEEAALTVASLIPHVCSVERINKNLDMIVTKVPAPGARPRVIACVFMFCDCPACARVCLADAC